MWFRSMNFFTPWPRSNDRSRITEMEKGVPVVLTDFGIIPQKWYWHCTGVKSTMFGECWRHKVVFVFGFNRPILLFLHLKSPKVAVLGCKKTGHLFPYIQRWLYISRRLTKINFAFWGTSHISWTHFETFHYMSTLFEVAGSKLDKSQTRDICQTHLHKLLSVGLLGWK